MSLIFTKELQGLAAALVRPISVEDSTIASLAPPWLVEDMIYNGEG